MEIKEGTLTDKGVTLVIRSTMNSVANFGSYYCIEQHSNDKWIEVIYIVDINTVGWKDIAYPVDCENEAIELVATIVSLIVTIRKYGQI
jgi:3-hydroxymyristoyl/3-hydroxydecanoyl-(acyl carrier protein) dehydratase